MGGHLSKGRGERDVLDILAAEARGICLKCLYPVRFGIHSALHNGVQFRNMTMSWVLCVMPLRGGSALWRGCIMRGVVPGKKKRLVVAGRKKEWPKHGCLLMSTLLVGLP